LSKSPVVIGNIGDYSGSSFTDEYRQALHGLETWVQWTNEHGGLNGHPVKLVSHDDQNDPAKSVLYMKQMVESDHVVAILSPIAQGTDSSWAEYVKDRKVPVIGGSALDANWMTNPYMLTANTTPVGYITAQLAAAKTIGKKFGMFTCIEQAACKSGVALFQQIAGTLGLGWAGAQYVSTTATDYIAPCLAMKAAGADVVAPESSAETIVRIVAACKQQNYHPGVVLPTANLDETAIANPALDGSLGVSYTPLWYEDTPVTHDFLAEYKKMFPDETPGGHAPQGWQAGVVLAAALKDAPDTVTSQTVLDGLYAQPANSTFGGWTPPITYVKGKPAQVKPCLWYTGIQNGKLTAPDGTDLICS